MRLLLDSFILWGQKTVLNLDSTSTVEFWDDLVVLHKFVFKRILVYVVLLRVNDIWRSVCLHFEVARVSEPMGCFLPPRDKWLEGVDQK